MKRRLVWRPRPGLRLVVLLQRQPPRRRPERGARLALRAVPGRAAAARGPATSGGGGVMRKKWIVPVAVAAAGLGAAVVWAGVPALRRYLKMERM
jgi:hypothetical protein